MLDEGDAPLIGVDCEGRPARPRARFVVRERLAVARLVHLLGVVPPEDPQRAVVQRTGEARLPEPAIHPVAGDDHQIRDAGTQTARVGHPADECRGDEGDRQGRHELQVTAVPAEREAHRVLNRSVAPEQKGERHHESDPASGQRATEPADRQTHRHREQKRQPRQPPGEPEPEVRAVARQHRVGVGNASALRRRGRGEQQNAHETHGERHPDGDHQGPVEARDDATRRIAEHEHPDQHRPQVRHARQQRPRPAGFPEKWIPGARRPEQRRPHHEPAGDRAAHDPPRDERADGVHDRDEDEDDSPGQARWTRTVVTGDRAQHLRDDVRGDGHDDGERAQRDASGPHAGRPLRRPGRGSAGRRVPGGDPPPSPRRRASP